jgi:phasin family protein
MTDITKINETFQKLSKDGFDAAVRSYGEVNKGFEALAHRVTENTKKAWEDSTRTLEQLTGAKSFEQVIEIQSQYAKRTYDNFVAEATKLGELYVAVVRDASKPFEQAFAKKTT